MGINRIANILGVAASLVTIAVLAMLFASVAWSPEYSYTDAAGKTVVIGLKEGAIVVTQQGPKYWRKETFQLIWCLVPVASITAFWVFHRLYSGDAAEASRGFSVLAPPAASVLPLEDGKSQASGSN